MRKKQDRVKCDVDVTCPTLCSLAPFTSPQLSVSALFLTPSSLFSSLHIASPAWLSTSAASNSRLLARPIWEEFAHPLKCMFSRTFIPFLLCSFFFSPAIPREQPATSLLASIKAKQKDAQKRNFCKPPGQIHMDKTNIQSFWVQFSLQQSPLCAVMG